MRAVAFALPAGDSRQRLLLQWLTREGPFLDDDREHGADVWFEHDGEVVTDTMLGELAHRSEATTVCAVSASPSALESDPLVVVRVNDDGARTEIELRNHVAETPLTEWMTASLAPMRSWRELSERSRQRCEALRFADAAFEPLRDQPFHPGVADGLLLRLVVLDELRRCESESGELSPRGQELRRMHFVGDKAWFSDSSDSERVEFEQELTFPHPDQAGATLFCPRHGKVKTPQMRIHYSDPDGDDRIVYVVYVGPKITKR